MILVARGLLGARPLYGRLVRHASSQIPRATPRRGGRMALGVAATALTGLYVRECFLVYSDQTEQPDTLFGNAAAAAYGGKSLGELVNSYIVFQLCQQPAFVRYGPQILKALEAVGLGSLAHVLVKHTFFRHFCGGEVAADVVPTVQALRAAQVGAIVDLSVESDMAAVASASSDGDLPPPRQDLVATAKTYVELLKQSVDIAAKVPGSMVAVKITAVAPPQLLKKMSDALTCLQTAFHQTASRAGRAALVAPDGRALLGWDDFVDLTERLPGRRLFSPDVLRVLFQAADGDHDGLVDWVDVSSLFSFGNPLARQMFAQGAIPVPGAKTDVEHVITTGEWAVLDSVRDELRGLCAQADALGVSVMVDAEQMRFQPAIDSFALELSRELNVGDRPRVFNTYQLYLKDGLARLSADYARAQRQGVAFGAKIVRGAYIVSERERAAEFGYPDPIHNDIEHTHASYHSAVDFCVDRLAAWESLASPAGSKAAPRGWNAVFHRSDDPEAAIVPDASATVVAPASLQPHAAPVSSAEFFQLYMSPNSTQAHVASRTPIPLACLIASHNRVSVAHAVTRLRDLGIAAGTPGIMFGQLFGMRDTLTYGLADNGYRAFKYLPYGPVGETLPYLIRRAQENASILSGAAVDLLSIRRELRQRLLPSRAVLQATPVVSQFFQLFLSGAGTRT